MTWYTLELPENFPGGAVTLYGRDGTPVEVYVDPPRWTSRVTIRAKALDDSVLIDWIGFQTPWWARLLRKVGVR